MSDEPTLKQLQDRARDLDVAGRSGMDRDELTAAIAAAEAQQRQDVATATTDDFVAPAMPTTAETGRPSLADVATERASRRASTRRDLDAVNPTQEG